MILLFNRTRCADQVIKDVLAFAARRVGVKGDTPVKVSTGRYNTEGVAYNSFPYLWYMKGGRRYKTKRTSHLIGNVGYITMSVPMGIDPLAVAESFMRVALHEMGHIRSYRDGTYGKEREPTTRTGRRIAHDQRPCEILANNYADDAIATRAHRVQRDELVLALAIAIESAQHGDRRR